MVDGTASARSTHPRPRAPWIWGISAIAGVIGAFLLWGASTSAQAPGAAAGKTAASSAPAPGQVVALATVEPTTGLITVGSRPGARIVQILVAPGDDVTEGQQLAILEGHDQAKAQLAMAEAQKAKADFQRETQKDKFALEREQSDKVREARLNTANQVADILKKKYGETSKLYNTLGATLTGRDKIEADSKYLELQIQTLKAELDQSLLQVEQELVPKQRALEDRQLDEANPEFLLADRQVELAKAALADTVVTAPRAGKILDVMARAGEVGSGQLLQMGDVSSMSAVAEVFQSDALRLRVGDRATVNILGAKIGGKVTRVGSVVGRNQAVNLDPRALRDLRVVRVTIALDEPEPAARLINLEAEAVITPGGGG